MKVSGTILHAVGGAVIVFLALAGFAREVIQHDWILSTHQWIEAMAWPIGGTLALFFGPLIVRWIRRRP